MLTEDQKELIAAAVDGDELTPVQAADFVRLLRTAPEAEALFQCLHADREHLRTLKRIVAPARVKTNVLAALNTLPIIEPRIPGPHRRRAGNWLPQAVAASLFLTVVAASCWLSLRDDRQADVVAQKQRLPRVAETASGRSTQTVATPRGAGVEAIPSPRPAPEATVPGHARPPVEVASAVEAAPAPRPHGVGELVASPNLTELRSPETVHLRLPFLAPVSEVDRPDHRAKLLDELARDPAFRLDLFARDTHRAAEVFQAAAKAAKVNLLVDAVARDRLAKKAPSAWMVYTETLSASEIAALLDPLAKSNRADKGTPFTTAHLIPAQQVEQREVRDLLGIDPGLWKRPRPATPAGPKPISANTADQIASSLLKSGASAQNTALMMTYLPANRRAHPMLSKEVKQFLDRRGERSPDAVPLIIVIRPGA